MNLSQVSRTAILTLICRAVVSEKESTFFNDPVASLCLERLVSLASAEERKWILSRKRFYAGISAHDARAGARRAKVFDEPADRFIEANPDCTVINLGCGFDTRYWRLGGENYRYIEVDLPEVVALKREVLKDRLEYEMIGCSVQDSSWIDRVSASGSSRFLFLAEGLLMFLPKREVTQLFQRLAQKFTRSQAVFDMVPEKYLRGLWKALLRLETMINWRLDVSWSSGIRDPRDIESYAPGLRVIGTAKGSAGPIITLSINAAYR